MYPWTSATESGLPGAVRQLPWALLLTAGLTGAAGDPDPVPVTLAPAAQLWFYPEHSAPAQVVPLNDARLSAQINARILAIPVRVGEQVATGDLLVELDCRDYDSRLQAQEANLQAQEIRLGLARAQFRRAQDLKRQRNVSDEEVDRRRAELQASEAERTAQREAIAQARLDRERCAVRAPFAAAVTERLAGVGTLAAPGTPLLHLVQLDDLEVSARLSPERLAGSLPDAGLVFEYLGERLPVHSVRQVPVVDTATRTRELRLRFRDRTAPAGAPGRLIWRDPVPHLPADLVLRRDGQLGVFLFDTGQARFQALPEALEGQPAAVRLAPDRRLILDGRDRLEDGMAVTATQATRPAGASDATQ
jgi:RND family efflux transporter MFP subunit